MGDCRGQTSPPTSLLTGKNVSVNGITFITTIENQNLKISQRLLTVIACGVAEPLLLTAATIDSVVRQCVGQISTGRLTADA